MSADLDTMQLRCRSTEHIVFAVTDVRAAFGTPAETSPTSFHNPAVWEREQQRQLKEWLRLKHGRPA